MYDGFNASNDNSDSLKDYASSIEKSTRILAIIIAVASLVAGFTIHGVKGALAGILIGASLAFAAYEFGSYIAKLYEALGDISSGVASNASNIITLDKKLDANTDDIIDTLKKDIENIKVVAATTPAPAKSEPAEAKKEEKPASKKPALMAKKEEKVVETKEEITEEVEAEPADEDTKVHEEAIEETKAEPVAEEKEAVPAPRKMTFTPFQAPPAQEAKKSPFASANTPKETESSRSTDKKVAPSPFAAKKESSTSETPAKKSSLYRCNVCGNMVNQTPCPRCAARGTIITDDSNTNEEVNSEAETHEENKSIWAAATKPVSASELASNASSLRKKETDVAEETAPAIKDEPKSPFANNKQTENESEAAPAKKKLYRCSVCGNMVNQTPCPRCAIKNKKSGEEAPAKEEESKEDVNPIWAAATKPGSFGPSGGQKLMSSNQPLTPVNSPLKAAKTATEAPSWAKPSPAVAEATTQKDEAPIEEKEDEPANTPARPIWERPGK